MSRLRFPTITGILCIFFLALFVLFSPSTSSEMGKLRVAFLDVGQGDAIFIESPTGTQVLVDGGKGGGVLPELGKEMGLTDRDIDMVVATHPDMDHIGGLIPVFERYDVDTILMTDNLGDTPTFDALVSSLEEEGSAVYYAKRGQVYDLGGSTTIEILFPDREMINAESNTSSIVLRVQYGSTSFLLTGDSPKEVETYLAQLDPTLLLSDVLKLGHHGSRTSTSEVFLNAVMPRYAIVSAGKDNSYGHPHDEVVKRVRERGILLLSTAEEGSITFVSDGTNIMRR